MKRYIQFVLDEYVDKKTGLIVQHHQWGDLGDWLSPSYEKMISRSYGNVISYSIWIFFLRWQRLWARLRMRHG
ncbi:hypothetical protein [Segatella copri]|uniref:hypothetical protein n=1 Tax=Segatella copri TaxID=165179 RepID=UPI003F592B99